MTTANPFELGGLFAAMTQVLPLTELWAELRVTLWLQPRDLFKPLAHNLGNTLATEGQMQKMQVSQWLSVDMLWRS